MSRMSSNSDPAKSFNVVFERQTPMSDEETQSDYPVISARTKSIVRDVTKQVLKKRLEEIQTEHQEAEEVNTKFSRLLDAVEHATVQENRVTDKFVSDVEQTMSCFDKNIGQLQTTYKNILEKLSKIESK